MGQITYKSMVARGWSVAVAVAVSNSEMGQVTDDTRHVIPDKSDLAPGKQIIKNNY